MNDQQPNVRDELRDTVTEALDVIGDLLRHYSIEPATGRACRKLESAVADYVCDSIAQTRKSA